MRMMTLAMALVAGSPGAQIPLPAAPAGATLFTRQCATCHSIAAGAPHRQGPNLRGVVGRQAGTAEGFRYSSGLAGTDWRWDEARLDAYLANPQSVVAGGIMVYRQNDPAIRARIIGWLKEQR